MSRSDGRNIHPESGIVEGEASEQATPADRGRGEGTVPFTVWEGVPSAGDGATYFDRPVLKEPVWIWAVPAYFYAGGVAGAAATLGAAAQLADRKELERLITGARWTAAVGSVAGSGLLIYDLGRPERFANMLRVFRPTSPMNLGSWILTLAAPLALGSAVLSRRGGARGVVGDAAGFAAGVIGLPLAGYTAVLLSSTAVPVWQQTRRSLPALFYSSAVSSAASLLDLLELPEREEGIVHRFGQWGKIADLAAVMAVERDAARVERVAFPLKRGLSGALWQASKILTAASLLSSFRSKGNRLRTLISAALGTAGGVALRFAVFYAGKASARDPRATFQQQRAGFGGAEVTGRPATAGP